MVDESAPAPPLSRARLTRVLALAEDAPAPRIRSAATRLLARLEARLERAEIADRAALEREIANLAASADHWCAAAMDPAPDRLRDPGRAGLAGALLGAALTLVLLVAYAAGLRIVRLDPGEPAAQLEEPAQLILFGPLPGATLRVLDADREELLLTMSAEEARVELASGRYALDVGRDDCPDRWTRSVFFEAGATHRFEPRICRGEGRITVRSNVSDDRLLIDGLEMGATGAQRHTVGVGDHEIRVEKKGFAAFEGRVRIRPNDELEIRAELVMKGEDSAPVGRPIPVTKLAPSLPPVSQVRPEPFDMAGLRKAISPPDLQSARGRMLHREGLEPIPDGGSTAWHDRVSRDLLARYDLDDSGQIDRLEESEAISCPIWQEIERDFDRGGLGLSMTRYYGFDGSEWHPDALGFARTTRSAAFAKMSECGLRS
ncbi:MAG: hypothetical protein CL908_25005 [Deltaproteobacteria bacterium]|jgi:hypothetical protein|nr:hypothetical protein [Deltaproteobacteria bacterium]